MRGPQLGFFQLLTLGQELDVHSALCPLSPEASVPVPPPDAKEPLEDNINRRLNLLQRLTEAFAVPDEFDERAVFGAKVGTAPLERWKGGIQQRMDFGLVAQHLSTVGVVEARGDDERMSP